MFLALEIMFISILICFDSLKVLPLRYSLKQLHYDSTHASVACIYEFILVGLPGISNQQIG